MRMTYGAKLIRLLKLDYISSFLLFLPAGKLSSRALILALRHRYNEILYKPQADALEKRQPKSKVLNFLPLSTTRSSSYTTTTITTTYKISITMGSIFSAIGRGIEVIIMAVAGLLMAIVGAITTVIVTIFDVIVDILCCRCFGSRRSGMRTSRRRGFGRRGVL
ncbi:hypothetical protein BJ138DRAFT_1140874 [Hygrophoropsis aurantiaca]|uniref:Uncharacterized protein n=1 Tax=Hygrophoropsis aurantiaca TaxID=72124 RepID=A0ACB8AQC9_9AGAM|nr:hypothetical protein BJ138DRAFT_1140874 [Hygrophoropsis aurantiaca]